MADKIVVFLNGIGPTLVFENGKLIVKQPIGPEGPGVVKLLRTLRAINNSVHAASKMENRMKEKMDVAAEEQTKIAIEQIGEKFGSLSKNGVVIAIDTDDGFSCGNVPKPVPIHWPKPTAKTFETF